MGEGDEKFVGWVRSMGWAALSDLWGRVRAGKEVASWPPGKAFEYLVLRAFELEGAQVVWPYRGWLEQVDGAVYVEGLSCLIECKHWKEPLDYAPIARFKARVDRRPPATVGLLFSVGGFTAPALHEAHVQPVRNVLLWEMSDVDLALRWGMRAALRVKWRKAVEKAEMDYELKGEDFR